MKSGCSGNREKLDTYRERGFVVIGEKTIYTGYTHDFYMVAAN
ncbi:tRNA-i(6)A37 methylthiotransferase [Heyndrickxia coagulans]|uniref:Uncharacterized protein n=1 Tax=Heyndrickxia coagulans TaxID=1398 RepID=A0AAN0T8X8_HEYCO|nr:hypothetical protein SB48_HM08orf03911 [Heyndrickxia coagulans]AKN55242.1 tRNA-i(6)A37 methylthiotransferase [Heyndrickxia coagulans]KYC59150.1 hypothetical protein B4100_3651 [Heyndrickxia coagulans]KYC89741.1 hypothetical protein B4096_3683 [Heyndrickxia coagulans]